MSFSFTLTTAATCLALMLVGGGLYEFLIVDPFWPKRLDVIQPDCGGIPRGRFWMPIHIHTLFELSVISALVAMWSAPAIRTWLWVALISHAIVGIWSAFDFIRKALALKSFGRTTH